MTMISSPNATPTSPVEEEVSPAGGAVTTYGRSAHSGRRTLVAVHESGLITGWDLVSNFDEVLAGWKASARKKKRALPITKIEQPSVKK